MDRTDKQTSQVNQKPNKKKAFYTLLYKANELEIMHLRRKFIPLPWGIVVT